MARLWGATPPLLNYWGGGGGGGSGPLAPPISTLLRHEEPQLKQYMRNRSHTQLQ